MVSLFLFPEISEEERKPFTEAEKKLEKKIFTRKKPKMPKKKK
jgi:hypothetical protein